MSKVSFVGLILAKTPEEIAAAKKVHAGSVATQPLDSEIIANFLAQSEIVLLGDRKTG